MHNLLAFSVVPLATLLVSAGYALVVTYRLWDWRPLLFIVVLLVMAVHQSNEIVVFLNEGSSAALAGFGEYPETTANLLSSAATVLLLRLVAQERDLAERFEDRVQERTAELESFAYSVSHDLRTPLRAIDGYAQILRSKYDEQLDEEGRRLLRSIYQSAQTMGALIDDLLALSRLSRRDIDRTTVDMEALAREVYEEAHLGHPEAADGTTFAAGSLPRAYADRSMIRQVLANLVSNALKFSESEEAPHIEVNGRKRDGEVVYWVCDNGVGFDEAYAEKMFGVFERLHDESDFTGTGVGLAIVKRVVERHGGRVWAKSEDGEGATFYFTLPNADAADDE